MCLPARNILANLSPRSCQLLNRWLATNSLPPRAAGQSGLAAVGGPGSPDQVGDPRSERSERHIPKDRAHRVLPVSEGPHNAKDFTRPRPNSSDA